MHDRNTCTLGVDCRHCYPHGNEFNRPHGKFRRGEIVVSVGGVRGTIVRHVKGADGGSYRVRWDDGQEGLIAPCNIRPYLRDDSMGAGAGW